MARLFNTKWPFCQLVVTVETPALCYSGIAMSKARSVLAAARAVPPRHRDVEGAQREVEAQGRGGGGHRQKAQVHPL